MIEVNYGARKEYRFTIQSEEAVQYDYGQILKINGLDIPDGTEIHFCQGRRAITYYITNNEVLVPDYMLSECKNINAYIYIIDASSGKTIRKIIIPIKPREKPGDYVEPEEPSYSRLLPVGGEDGQILSIVNGQYTWVNYEPGTGPGPEPLPEQIQSDWNITDTTSPAYIVNKPTRLSQFINDNNFIPAVPGTSLITDAEKEKLASIEIGANKNVQSDWNNNDVSSYQHILNRPTALSQFNNDMGYISTVGDILMYDTIRSDNYMFQQSAKVRATFGTPNLLNASLVKGIFNTKFDGYNTEYIKFYCSDTFDGDDWQPFVPGSFTEQRKTMLISGDIATNLFFPLGLHNRYCIEIENDNASYFWLEYFTLICTSSRSRISFSMEAYIPFYQRWDEIVKRQATNKTSEHYPLEVLHPSVRFDFRVENNKYNKIRYIFYTEQIYDTVNLESSYNRLNLYKLRHFGSYPANISSLNTLTSGLFQDENGNAYVRGKFRLSSGNTVTNNNDLTNKLYVDTAIAAIREILTRNNIT